MEPFGVYPANDGRIDNPGPLILPNSGPNSVRRSYAHPFMSTTKPRGRKPLRYLLLDFPSDHEVDGSLATECSVINALLANNDLGTRTKHFRLSSLASFKKLPYYSYDPKFVHVACHAGPAGIGLIEGWVTWRKFAEELKAILQPLEADHRRILTLSCCHSPAGATELKAHLKGYFTGIYHFHKDKVPFAQAFAVWTMFFLKKDIKNPHEKIRLRINTFFETDTIEYSAVSAMKFVPKI